MNYQVQWRISGHVLDPPLNGEEADDLSDSSLDNSCSQNQEDTDQFLEDIRELEVCLPCLSYRHNYNRLCLLNRHWYST